jgi:hypothetical protein
VFDKPGVYTFLNLEKMKNYRRRHAFSSSEGISILMAGIFLVIFLYFVAFAVPGALTAIATAALTSVDPGIVVIFQTLFSLVAVFVFILILVAVLRKVSE